MTGPLSAEARAVVDAWVIEGPRPDLHREAQRQLRAAWPTLAGAIERLARLAPGEDG